ncbi:sensor histidine kinase [Halovenus halobia]|uniref:sensor histidine kinase n=1 Tax=Halovenus halobia TaxID=3396622 RepID=UPI003F556A2C
MTAEHRDGTPSPVDSVSLDTLALHSTDLLTVLDTEGVIQYESPAVECLYGFEQDELVGDHIEDYVHPDDRERTLAAFRRVVADDDGTVESAEFRHKTAAGTYLWVESAASANPTPEGYYVVNTRDISAAKQRERNLERTNERLDEFASVLSHDLRNPLTVAQLRLQLAADEHPSDHLDAVADAHDRIDALITDVLALARSGEQIGPTELVALKPLVSDCWESVASWDATLHCEVTGRIHADPSRLRQLFENLFRNSVEHGSTTSNSQTQQNAGEHTDGHVTVNVGSLVDGFYVEDDGTGIPADQREAVFETGYSGLADGTGLGLQIVEQIVEAHGWEIQIVEAEGARFEITGVETV